jgi:hypothetical protein
MYEPNDLELISLGQLHTHPGWSVFKKLFENKLEGLMLQMAGDGNLNPEEAYTLYRRLNALTVIKDELFTLPRDAAHATDPVRELRESREWAIR